MPGDLHNHTTYSDGSVPVARLPLMAARVGLDAMAISDHDTLRDRKSTRLNSSHIEESRMPSSA